MAYAHLPGRCPECRCRIEAPRPDLRPPVPSAIEDGLLPIEEEWPEAGQLLNDDATPTYTFSNPPPDWELNSPARTTPLVETEETYSFAPGEEPPPVEAPARAAEAQKSKTAAKKPAKARHEPYGMLPVEPNTLPPVVPDADMLADPEESERSKLREPMPVPPVHPFLEGLWTFPFRPAMLLALFWLGIGFLIVGLLATLMVFCADEGGPALLGIAIGAPLAVGLFLWSGTYAANGFFAVVEETSAGADQIRWPSGGQLAEGFSKLFYLLWLGTMSGVVVGLPWLLLLNAVDGGLWWTVLAVVPWTLLFPVFLFSSMAASSRMLLLEPHTVAAFFKKPRVALILVLASGALFASPLALTFIALNGPNFLAAVFGGFLWAVCFILYARLLGRAGYVLMQGGRRRRKKEQA
jgi:hypothetical protein